MGTVPDSGQYAFCDLEQAACVQMPESIANGQLGALSTEGFIDGWRWVAEFNAAPDWNWSVTFYGLHAPGVTRSYDFSMAYISTELPIEIFPDYEVEGRFRVRLTDQDVNIGEQVEFLVDPVANEMNEVPVSHDTAYVDGPAFYVD